MAAEGAKGPISLVDDEDQNQQQPNYEEMKIASASRGAANQIPLDQVKTIYGPKNVANPTLLTNEILVKSIHSSASG